MEAFDGAVDAIVAVAVDAVLSSSSGTPASLSTTFNVLFLNIFLLPSKSKRTSYSPFSVALRTVPNTLERICRLPPLGLSISGPCLPITQAPTAMRFVITIF